LKYKKFSMFIFSRISFINQSLSMKLSRPGISGLRPFLVLILMAT